MVHRIFAAIVAGSALLLTSPASASQEGSGGIWSKRTNSKAKAKSQAEKAEERERKQEEARRKSQGSAHASASGLSHASDQSVLAAGAVASSALPGLSAGLQVMTSAGTSLGTVSEIVTDADGSIRLVIVSGPGGESYRLLPNQLSISGGVVTTTQTDIGG